MPYLTNLADIARRTGFPVIEQPGWRTRGHGQMGQVRSVIAHHDAANQAPGTFNTAIQNGHLKLAGPLSHFALRRDGTIHVVAAGLCYHAGATINNSLYANNYSVGIEAGNNGLGEPWPRRQLDAYEQLCAELCKAFGLGADRVRGHKEIAAPLGRKPDPAGINMQWFRDAVARRMSGGGGSTPSAPGGIESMAFNDSFQDWAGNNQSVLSWMNNVDKRVAATDAKTNDLVAKVNDVVNKVGSVHSNIYYGGGSQSRLDNSVFKKYPSLVEGSTWTGDIGDMVQYDHAAIVRLEKVVNALAEKFLGDEEAA